MTLGLSLSLPQTSVQGAEMKEWFKAKIAQGVDRVSQPPLSPEEQALFRRYRACCTAGFREVDGLVVKDFPVDDSLLNRTKIREVLHQAEFPGHLAKLERYIVELHAAYDAREARALADRLNQVGTFYANELNPVELPLAALLPHLGDWKKLRLEFFETCTGEKLMQDNPGGGMGVLLGAVDAGRITSYGSRLEAAITRTVLRRTLRDFPPGERTLLRLASVLEAMEAMTSENLLSVRVPLLWNDGRTLMAAISPLEGREQVVFIKMMKDRINAIFGTQEYAAEQLQTVCRQILENSNTPASIRAALLENLYSGSRWLKPEMATTLAPKGATPSALRLGIFEEGGELLYDRNESLATIAPPGAGKSQGLLRNLLYLNAPAVVLDVKGEMFDGSAGWRSQNVGPVYRFAPADPASSIQFNPLDFISRDEDEAYEQSERLAELLTVEPPKGDYFDKRAIQVIRSIVLFVALTYEGPARSMDGVLDLLNGGIAQPKNWRPPDNKKDQKWDGIAELVIKLSMSDAPSLQRLGRALEYMPDKQREGVFDSARTALKVWESPGIARLTKVTTFAPHFLRQQRATLYLCVNLDDVKRYASVLRVLMGMSLAHFTSGKAEAQAEPVTFFFDELPRLGRMDVVETALDTARGFGVRLWLFCQNMGQLETTYPNAKGMLGNCLARIYMNPNEDTAKWLSEHLGERHGLLDGQKKPLAEKYDLTGSDYADSAVVMLNGFDNARIKKFPAWADSACKARLNLPIKART